MLRNKQFQNSVAQSNMWICSSVSGAVFSGRFSWVVVLLRLCSLTPLGLASHVWGTVLCSPCPSSFCWDERLSRHTLFMVMAEEQDTDRNTSTFPAPLVTHFLMTRRPNQVRLRVEGTAKSHGQCHGHREGWRDRPWTCHHSAPPGFNWSLSCRKPESMKFLFKESYTWDGNLQTWTQLQPPREIHPETIRHLIENPRSVGCCLFFRLFLEDLLFSSLYLLYLKLK